MGLLGGYGRGWSEPKAVGGWARFKQRMREPMTRDDVYIGAIVFAVLTVAIPAMLYLLAI